VDAAAAETYDVGRTQEACEAWRECLRACAGESDDDFSFAPDVVMLDDEPPQLVLRFEVRGGQSLEHASGLRHRE